ncbi:MAG: TetR/AcrR family transcriptional regulator [Pseudomonadota bacterium]
MSVGLAYYHFESKAGLLAAVVDRFYAPLREIPLGETIPVSAPWAARERARTHAFIDHFYGHPIAPLIAGRLGREPEVRDVENAHMSALLAAGERNPIDGQRRGVVSGDINPKIIIGLLMGGLRQAIDAAVLKDPRPPRAERLDGSVHGALAKPKQMSYSAAAFT